MAKKLMIDCANCDARFVTEETLAAYESVSINAATVVVTPESKELLNRYGVNLNCADVRMFDKDVQLRTINGKAQIRAADQVAGRSSLMVNGSLEIGPDTQKVLDSYESITVNGSVTLPEGLSGYLGKMTVNGSTICYPDGAVVLKRSAVIDRLFALRAKEQLYWSAKKMVMVDPRLDGSRLAQKGARFSSREVILAEGKVEEMIDLIDEKADIIIVPDGTAVVLDDAELTDMLVKKHGTKLYIDGDLNLTEESAAALEKLEYLNVQGDALMPAALKQLFVEKADHLEGELSLIWGRRVEHKLRVQITSRMLQREEEGITLDGCVEVTLDADIPEELILEKLRMENCAKVICAPGQQSAVQQISTNTAEITAEDADTGMLKSMLGGDEKMPDTKMVNAADYIL